MQKTEKGKLTKATAVLVDPTGSVKCLFQEEWATCAQENQTYAFSNLHIKENYYTKEKLIDTAKYGFSLEISTPFTEEIAKAEPTLATLTESQTEVQTIGVKTIGTYFVCHSCSKKTETEGNFL